MAWRMKCADFDAANVECRVMGRSFGHIKTLCPANDWEGEVLELIAECQLYNDKDNGRTLMKISIQFQGFLLRDRGDWQN